MAVVACGTFYLTDHMSIFRVVQQPCEFGKSMHPYVILGCPLAG